MTDRIDIHDPLTEICERLGLEPQFVSQLLISPFTVTATVYEKNENGEKYVDALTAVVAAAEKEFEVKT